MSKNVFSSYSFVFFMLTFVVLICVTMMTWIVMQAMDQKESFVNWKKITTKTGKALKKMANKTGVTKVAKQIEKYGKTSIHELKKAKQVNWKLLATSPTQVVHKNTGCESKDCLQIPKTIHTSYGRIIVCEKVDSHLRKHVNKILYIEIDKIAIQPKMVTMQPLGKITIQFAIPSIIDKHHLTCKPHLGKQSVFQPIPKNPKYLKMYWNQKIIFIKKDGTQKIKIISHQKDPYLSDYLVTIQFTCADLESFMPINNTVTKKAEVFLNKASNIRVADQKPPSPPALTAATALSNFKRHSSQTKV